MTCRRRPTGNLLIAIAALAGLIAVLAANSTAAQPLQPIERLEVVVWPEYDQPSVLVMYRAWLPLQSPLPTTVSLPMPASVPKPSAVAKRPIGGELLLTPYTIETADGWSWAHIQSDAPEVRLEFYVELDSDSPSRVFRFEWPGGPAIQQISYEVMQPVGATDLVVSPGSGQAQRAADGLVYQREDIGGVPEGGQFFIDVRYTKAAPGLTISALDSRQAIAPPVPPPSSPTAESPSPAAEPTQTDSAGPVWLTILPVILIAAIIVFWFVLRSPRAQE